MYEAAFKTASNIFNNCITPTIRGLVTSLSFTDGIHCLTEFACNEYFQDIPLLAVSRLRECSIKLATAPQLFLLVPVPF